MIKGTYEAKITLTIHADENEPGLRKFDDLKHRTEDGELTKDIQQLLMDEIFWDESQGECLVEQQFAELHLE